MTTRERLSDLQAAHVVAVEARVKVQLDWLSNEASEEQVAEAAQAEVKARAALDAELDTVCRDAEASALDDDLSAEALSDLEEAQRALVLLANQLERHSVPFVPAAEAATAKARRDIAQDGRLLALGMAAAAAALAAAARSGGQDA